MVFFKIVEKNSFWYCFFRKWLSLIFRYSYCGNFYVRGRKNVPKAGTPIMFVSNHQNGVIDALSILFAMPIRYKVPVRDADPVQGGVPGKGGCV